MHHHNRERAELLELLIAAIRSRSHELTEDEAGAVANLWILRRDLLARNVENQLFAALSFAEHLKELRKSLRQLEPKLRVIHDDERRIVPAAGLSSHRGWLAPVEESAWIDDSKHTIKPYPVCAARIVQWAVGQGGFWTTSGVCRPRHSLSERKFEIVFDCGSSTAGALSHALREYRPANGTIDYLFLSHLDQDHTAGIDELLSNHRIDTVIMPLLNPAATVLASARLAAQGSVSVVETELLTDPGTYLRERGVRRVILVQNSPEDGGPDSPRASTPGEPPESPVESHGRIPFEEIVRPGRRGPGVERPFPNAEIVPHATTFWLLGADRRVFWQLAPYVHPFEPLRIGRFMQSAYKLFDAVGPSGSSVPQYAALRSILTSASGLRDLKRLYKLVRSDHNSVSMSLFSCPCPSADGHSQLSIRVSRANGSRTVVRPSSPRLGWLHTGDSTLARASYRREWLAYYEKVLTHVAVLVVPHHGSRHNFHRELFSIPAPPVALACASRTNSYGHPAAAVARSAKVIRSMFHQVDERAESAVIALYLD